MWRPQSLIPLAVRKSLGGRWESFVATRHKERLLHRLAGNAVQCNICSWTGAAFTDDQWHPGTICPNCGSQVRHRLLVGALDGRSSLPGLSEADLIGGRDVLHFAPERQLRERIRNSAAHHVTADFDRGDCDLRLDISAMPSVPGESFHTVISCDVLEHVPSDHAAFAEILRVLRPGGIAILSVPQKDPPAQTDEDPTVRSESEREQRFGQKDHVRMYGDDFIERVRLAGFNVTVLDESHFSKTDIARHGLTPPVPSHHPLATNKRRLYFCRKSN